jgi:hypothetical protein
MVIYRAVTSYKRNYGALPNILFPSTFTEKLHFRKLFDRREILPRLVDKLEVRDYVAARIGPDQLPKLYFAGDPEHIPFGELPQSYVIKPSHGSGWIRIVADQGAANRTQIVAECKEWLRKNYFYVGYEWPYKPIPRRILVEEYLGDAAGAAPADYKFFVFDGRVALIQIDLDRFSKHTRALYDATWRRLDVRYLYEVPKVDIHPPHALEEMKEMAVRLAAGFDFLRVDLYELPDRIVFGEITPIPEAGMARIEPYDFDRYLGRLWKQPRPWWLPGRRFSRWN